MIRVVSTDIAYERILDRSTGALTEAINGVARAFIAGKDRAGAIARLANVIGKNCFLSELLGRESTAQVARHVSKSSFRDSPVIVVPQVTFTEAVADIVKRTPEVAEFATPEYVAEIVKRGGFTLARAADVLIVDRVQKAIAAAVEIGKTGSDATAIIAEIGDWSRAYSETVYRTNIARSFSGGRMAQVEQPGVREAIPAFRYSAIHDDSVRENHWAADGLVAPVGHVVWTSFKPPLGFNCFLPTTRVSGRFVAGSKARYAGPAVQIQTQHGGCLSVTVNHPVLTADGWRPAGQLREGDNLFRHRRGIESFGHRAPYGPFADVLEGRRAVHNENVPSSVEDVFEAIRGEGVMAGGFSGNARVTPLDLHGDARFTQGEIEVVRTARLLPRDSDVEFFQSVRNLQFALSEPTRFSSEGLRSPDPFVDGNDPSGASLPRGSALALDDGGVIWPSAPEGPLKALRFGLAAQMDAEVTEYSRHHFAADPEFLRQLESATPGEILPDKILRVRHFNFTGHVYDLETEGGWILAENIVTSNCRCGLDFIDRYDYDYMRKEGILRGGVFYPKNFSKAGPDPGFTIA